MELLKDYYVILFRQGQYSGRHIGLVIPTYWYFVLFDSINVAFG